MLKLKRRFTLRISDRLAIAAGKRGVGGGKSPERHRRSGLRFRYGDEFSLVVDRDLSGSARESIYHAGAPGPRRFFGSKQ